MKLNKEESLIYVLKQIRKLINIAIGDDVEESHALEPRKGSYGAKQNKRDNYDNREVTPPQGNNCEVCD